MDGARRGEGGPRRARRSGAVRRACRSSICACRAAFCASRAVTRPSQAGDAGVLLLGKPVQPLDGRQRHAVGIHGADMRVVPPHARGGVKVLRHGADVAMAGVLAKGPGPSSNFWS